MHAFHQPNRPRFQNSYYWEKNMSVKYHTNKSSRFRLQQDVYELQRSLVQELELRTVLQTAMECYSSKEFPNQSFISLPHRTCKDISNLKTSITKLEKEVETLNSQLIQERAQTQIVEDKLKQNLKGESIVVNNPQILHHPNMVSEEMVRSMKTIFITLSESSSNGLLPLHLPHGKISNSNWSGIQGKLYCSEDIGSYRFGIEVSWMSVGKKHLDLAAKELKRFRCLIQQLGKVSPGNLKDDEKLAFWINLYNALMMHAYLAYGVPTSDYKLVSLMQKANYTVGGHAFSAVTIQYVVLRMKPQIPMPQTVPKFKKTSVFLPDKLKVLEERRKFSIKTPEPLLTFGLSNGMFSSPAVRIYSADGVRRELEEAQRDYIRASVGLSMKGKLLIPKLVHCFFARNFVDESSNLPCWICRFLFPNSNSHQSPDMHTILAGSRSYVVLPHDSRFRYIFLP